MSRISKAFANKDAFIGYLTAGDSEKEDFLQLLELGVNLLEVGIPFSDPVADGPVIQQAMQRALQKGMTPEKTLALVADLRQETEVPIVLFTYFNPIQKDLKRFLLKAKKAGADGILVVDLPIEEAAEYQKFCALAQLEPIFLMAPSTSRKRMAQIAKIAQGFIYYACRKGITGARAGLPADLSEKIAQIREHTHLPIAVGFGISDRKTADAVLQIADGFVVGSYFVERKKDDFRIKR
jgi:tryptophan synthase alpha chain